MHCLKIFVITLLLSCSLNSLVAQQDVAFEKAVSGMNISKAMQTVKKFSSPSFDGRMPGSPGYIKAAAYSEKLFRKAGLKPAFSGGYYQYVKVETNTFLKTPGLSITYPGNRTEKLVHGTDFVCRGFSGSGKFALPLIFCGYGIESVTGGYNDYMMIKDTSYIAVVFKNNPNWKMEGEDYSKMLTRYKANKARAKGAKGIIFIPSALSANPQQPIGSIMDGPGINDPQFPQFQISNETAYKLFSETGTNPALMQSRIDSLRHPFSMPLNISATVNVSVRYDTGKPSPNIAAIIEGSDPLLKNEFIVIGAHLDHVGRQGKKLYFPGANDNASGCAAVLYLAEFFSNPEFKPKRSLCFVLYTSEEQGLLGSEYFAANFTSTPSVVAAALNLDCIGHGDSIQIGSGKTYPQLWEIAMREDQKATKRMVKESWAGGGADAEAFHKRGIPVMYFVSKYSYTHLHLPSDKPSTINVELYADMIRLAARVIRVLSTDPTLLKQ